jgi:hypothetical protein
MLKGDAAEMVRVSELLSGTVKYIEMFKRS